MSVNSTMYLLLAFLVSQNHIRGYAHQEYHLCKQEAVLLLKDGIDLITDSDKALSDLLSYPLYATLAR